MESYYSWRHTTALRAMRRTLNDYYDSDTAGMLRLRIRPVRTLRSAIRSGGLRFIPPLSGSFHIA